MKGFGYIGIILTTIFSCNNAIDYFENYCGDILNVGDSGGVMQSGMDWLDTYYSINLDCVVTLQASAGRQILLTWIEYDVATDVFGNCADRLRVHDGAVLAEPILNLDKQCGAYIEYNETVGKGNFLTLHLMTGASEIDTHNFQFVFTSFTTGTCGSDEFKCKNGRCIDENLADIFDFYDNCGDGSDLDGFGDAVSGLLRWGLGILIAIVVGIAAISILICICCVCMCYHCCCKSTSSSGNNTTVVHANPPPPPPPDGGMAMHQHHQHQTRY